LSFGNLDTGGTTSVWVDRGGSVPDAIRNLRKELTGANLSLGLGAIRAPSGFIPCDGCAFSALSDRFTVFSVEPAAGTAILNLRGCIRRAEFDRLAILTGFTSLDK
jgi:hypothetical protein